MFSPAARFGNSASCWSIAGSYPSLFNYYLCESGLLSLIDVLPLLIEVKVLLLLRITSLLIPVSHKRLGLELTVEVRRLFYYEVSVHKLQLIIN